MYAFHNTLYILIFLLFIVVFAIFKGCLIEKNYKKHPFKLLIITVLLIQMNVTFGYFLGKLLFDNPLVSLLPLAFGIAIIWKIVKLGKFKEIIGDLLSFIGVCYFMLLFLFLIQDIPLRELPQEILKQWKYVF